MKPNSAASAPLRIKFFVDVQTGKRSFQSRAANLTYKSIALLSALSEFAIIDTSSGDVVFHPQRVKEHRWDSKLQSISWDSKVKYQVIPVRPQVNSDEKHLVGTIEEIRGCPGSRKRIPLAGRDVLVFALSDGSFSAMDAVCYHFGGPLETGDIEESHVDGRMCVVCPWHRYKIDVCTGERITKANESLGVKQRMHNVSTSDDGNVYVSLNCDDEEFASDHYAFMGLWKYDTSDMPRRVHSSRT